MIHNFTRHNLRKLLLVLMLLPVVASASNTFEGQNIYQRHCVMCHGNQGISTMPSAPSFKRGEGLFQSDMTLLQRIKSGKNACPAYIGLLKNQQIYDVIAYLRTLYP